MAATFGKGSKYCKNREISIIVLSVILLKCIIVGFFMQVGVFEVYDLQFECQYNINVSAVTKSGVQGKPTSIKLVTPICEKIYVKGNSLPPECPQRGNNFV
jgi:hypothetical protein